MTAEIAIMNKRGVALAADSAVTVEVEGGTKVFPSANKMFTLSKYNPVGVMIYSGAEMAGVPWEVALKSYRDQLGDTNFDRLEKYSTDLVKYLENHGGLYPENQQNDFAESEVREVFRSIRSTFMSELTKIVTGRSDRDSVTPEDLLTEIIDTNLDAAKERELFQDEVGNSWSKDTIRQIQKNHLQMIRRVRDKIFSGVEPNSGQKRKLTEIGKRSLTQAVGGMGFTGLVIAGFGTNDYFPVISAIELYGFVGGKLRYLHRRSKATRISSKNDAAIVPFAQSEMVTTFMEGVDPSYQLTVNIAVATAITTLSETILESTRPDWSEEQRSEIAQNLRDSILKDLRQTLENDRWQYFIRPIISVVSTLPKTELASMAESLVNLTSMKRRVSSGSETVGGPIDVALISKGDGFVWIKRKHYFDKDLNYQFFANYFRTGGRDETESED